MSYFLSNDDVVTYAHTFDERLLRGMNIIWQMRLKSISNAFSYDFVDRIAKTNRSIISWN
jgi:hypothetical protein